ncbi:aldehyde dehydrogenase family protein [Sphingobium sp. SJ10-10]|uniref:aldehyde dehydrogenase family protein n=1 Tax=Sphingobium sp. SJ10-10 TaxID=3114999 RepID=UPI003312FAAD
MIAPEGALSAARRAFHSWKRVEPASRDTMLLAAAARLRDEIDNLGRLLTQEQGKPLEEAR